MFTLAKVDCDCANLWHIRKFYKKIQHNSLGMRSPCSNPHLQRILRFIHIGENIHGVDGFQWTLGWMLPQSSVVIVWHLRAGECELSRLPRRSIGSDCICSEKSYKVMEEPILNAHNKAEYEPAHSRSSAIHMPTACGV
jgi:hypothetical protein